MHAVPMLLLCVLCSWAHTASAAAPAWLEPTYHFHRAKYHMNDPNVKAAPMLSHLFTAWSRR